MESEWKEVLRRECDAASQAHVSRRLGVSEALISLVLSGKYAKRTDRLAAKVIEVFAPAPPPPPPPEPEWLQVLRKAVAQKGSKAVGERLNTSFHVIAAALRRGQLAKDSDLELRVRGGLMGETVTCAWTWLGDITHLQCLTEQAKPLPEREYLRGFHNICRKCPHNRANRARSAR